jgi:hypothetical protein
MDKVNFLVRNIDKKLWQKFRLLCLKKGESANSFIKKLIKQEITKNKT